MTMFILRTIAEANYITLNSPVMRQNELTILGSDLGNAAPMSRRENSKVIAIWRCITER